MADKKKILLIDDEEDFCFFLKNNLEDTGEFEVMTATNGEEGLVLAKTKSPDLILLDVIMPGVSGTAVAENLLSDPKTVVIPIIFLTAVVEKAEMENASYKEIGGNKFIAKATSVDEVAAAIKSVLNK